MKLTRQQWAILSRQVNEHAVYFAVVAERRGFAFTGFDQVETKTAPDRSEAVPAGSPKTRQ